MARDWSIPRVEEVANTGPEWLFSLLEPLDEDTRMIVLMIMWRVWHVRNEITHEKKPPPTEASRRFLQGYINSLLCIKQHPGADMEKGKMVVRGPQQRPPTRAAPKEDRRWIPPGRATTKLNTDGSFDPATGSAGGGMILRDERGNIIFTACRELRACDNALAAELAACKEGLDLALHRTDRPIAVEMDSAEAVSMCTAASIDRSVHRSIIHEIKRLAETEGRKVSFSHCSRSQNKVSHELASYGRRTPRTAVWFHSGTDAVVTLVMAEMPP